MQRYSWLTRTLIQRIDKGHTILNDLLKNSTPIHFVLANGYLALESEMVVKRVICWSLYKEPKVTRN